MRSPWGQTQVGDVGEIIGPVDLHDVRAWPLALSPGFHQPQHPDHASTLGQRTDAKVPNWPAHPQSCGSPHHRPLCREDRMNDADFLPLEARYASMVPDARKLKKSAKADANLRWAGVTTPVQPTHPPHHLGTGAAPSSAGRPRPVGRSIPCPAPWRNP